MDGEIYYKVKESWLFNLESMSDKLFCISDDLEKGLRSFPITIAHTIIEDFDGIENLKTECDNLRHKAVLGVDGYEYNRIFEIVEWRVSERYNACINAGMPEEKAMVCFEDI